MRRSQKTIDAELRRLEHHLGPWLKSDEPKYVLYDIKVWGSDTPITAEDIIRYLARKPL